MRSDGRGLPPFRDRAGHRPLPIAELRRCDLLAPIARDDRRNAVAQSLNDTPRRSPVVNAEFAFTRLTGSQAKNLRLRYPAPRALPGLLDNPIEAIAARSCPDAGTIRARGLSAQVGQKPGHYAPVKLTRKSGAGFRLNLRQNQRGTAPRWRTTICRFLEFANCILLGRASKRRICVCIGATPARGRGKAPCRRPRRSKALQSGLSASLKGTVARMSPAALRMR
jgi:hypothetical protein